MEVIRNLDIAKCAAMGCKQTVKKHTTSKRILCKKCWHSKAEEAALSRNSLMHIAHSDKPHEFVVINHLEEFIEEFDIEGREV
jgi:hypothetical protein